MGTFDGVTREHVKKALEVIDREGVPEKYRPREWALVHEGRVYPVKYTLKKAAEAAGLRLTPGDFTAAQAVSYLKKLGFKVDRIKSLIVLEAGDRFVEHARSRGITIRGEQLTPLKGSRKVYRKVMLPNELMSKFPELRKVHFEWLAEGTPPTFSVGLHIEFSKAERSRELGDHLMEKINLEELGEKVGTTVERKDGMHKNWTWFMAYRTSMHPEEEMDKLVEWMAEAMFEFYVTFIPALGGEIMVIHDGMSTKEALPIFDKITGLLERKGQLILYGPPGTGKTWLAKRYVDFRNPGNGMGDGSKTVEFVTFHPAFSYEDFVEGIKPETHEDPETGRKELLFSIQEGIFKGISRRAYNALLEWAGIPKRWEDKSGVPELTQEEKGGIRKKLSSSWKDAPKFYLVIDEINRGDISKTFGELITLLEKDKRLFMENETLTTLPYSKKRFGVPPNLYIIGTMNTSDRSIALIDVALRRRFGFIEVMPDYDVIKKHIIDKASEGVKPLAEDALKALETLNKRIRREYDRDHQVGHSYYFSLREHSKDKDAFLGELKMIWFHEILPLLQEYFYDSPEKLRNVLKTREEYYSLVIIDNGDVKFRQEEEFNDQEFIEALRSLISAESE